MSVEMLLALNASCAECDSLGPPPSAILTLPPPPMPAFLRASSDGAADGDAPCDPLQGLEGLTLTCDWPGGRAGTPGVEFVELPRQVGGMGVNADDDTWFMVLVSCCAGVILLGAVLAVVLMRCRQGRGSKCVLSLDPSALDGHGGKSSKLVGVHGEVLYPDPLALWAALTPSGGTQHFVGAAQLAQPVAPPPHLQLTQRHLTAPSPTPQRASPPVDPQGLQDLAAAEPEYAMPPPPAPQPHSHSQPRHHAKPKHVHINKMATLSHASHAANLGNLGAMIDTSSFDNSGFVDSDDQLLCADAYPHLNYYHTVGGNRRAAAIHSVMAAAAHGAHSRPKVSSPTHIANPNMPPLNLHPTASMASMHGHGAMPGAANAANKASQYHRMSKELNKIKRNPQFSQQNNKERHHNFQTQASRLLFQSLNDESSLLKNKNLTKEQQGIKQLLNSETEQINKSKHTKL
ncbi:uncharacterized protein LOC117652752 [Thrips palmi]|uniref:Uncharacterized protein LOC117652752 n=1 Tax=Thrips palmi TaxID=161013 RepID=A0A6P9A847_THRPL|nr:uncharacterized protein LOC117652752 [Thrips palmi]